MTANAHPETLSGLTAARLLQLPAMGLLCWGAVQYCSGVTAVDSMTARVPPPNGTATTQMFSLADGMCNCQPLAAALPCAAAEAVAASFKANVDKLNCAVVAAAVVAAAEVASLQAWSRASDLADLRSMVLWLLRAVQVGFLVAAAAYNMWIVGGLDAFFATACPPSKTLAANPAVTRGALYYSRMFEAGLLTVLAGYAIVLFAMKRRPAAVAFIAAAVVIVHSNLIAASPHYFEGPGHRITGLSHVCTCRALPCQPPTALTNVKVALIAALFAAVSAGLTILLAGFEMATSRWGIAGKLAPVAGFVTVALSAAHINIVQNFYTSTKHCAAAAEFMDGQRAGPAYFGAAASGAFVFATGLLLLVVAAIFAKRY